MTDAAVTGTRTRVRPTADVSQRFAQPPRSDTRARLELEHERRQRAEAKAAADWEALRGKRCRVDHLPTLTAFYLFLDGAIRAADRGADRSARLLPDGSVEIHRSKPQIIRGMARWIPDWRPSGHAKADNRRYAKYVRRRLEDAVELGLVEPIDGRAWETLVDERGESPGILIRVPAGVAQSVRAAES